MGLNIDELEVKISGSSEKVEKSIDKLIAKLEALKKSVNRTSGLDKLAEKINKISASIHSITGIDKLSQMAESIGKLSSIKSPNVTKTVNSIRKLSEAYNSIGSMGNVNLESLKSSISVIADACKPMENMGKNNFAPFLNSLKKIPEITKNLDNSKIEEFAKRIRQLTAAIEPLTSSVSKAEKGLVALNGIVKSSVASNGNLAAANAAATKSYTSLSTVLRDVRTKIISVYVGLSKTSDFLADCFQSSNEYVENVNLFTVAMGEYADEAYSYAEQVNKLLGIDISEWIRFQGVFKQITTGFGVAAEKSNLMSKNLTQIGYDIASFYNISIEESMQKIQSGISGELEPLRRLGYALDAATLQQIAYDNGISQNINTMTQAQKSQLRYIAIMQQSTNVMGDMARTIVTPANSMRILQQQMEQLKRAIGNIVSVFAVKLIPYVQVLIRLLTDAANAIADWLGFELPTIDYSQAGKGLTSVTEGADNATEAVKETQEQLLALAGFDEINQLNLDKGKKGDSGDTTIGNNYDLGIDLPEYDFLAGLDKQTDKLYKQIKNKLKDIYEWLKKHKKIIGTIAGILTGIWAVGKIKKFIGKVKDLKTAFDNLSVIKTAKDWLKNFTDGFKKARSDGDGLFASLNKGVENFRSKLSKTTKFLGTIVGTVAAGYGSYNLFKSLTTDTLTWKKALGDAALIVGGLGVSWLFGGGVGLAIGIITTAIAGMVGALKGVDDEIIAADKAYTDSLLFNNGGIKIDEFTGYLNDQFSSVSDLNEVLSDYDGKISDAHGAVEESLGILDSFRQSLGTTRTFSGEEIDKIKESFSDLTTNMKSEFAFNTDKIFAAFRGQSRLTAEKLGLDVGEMTTILQKFQNDFNTSTDTLNVRANELLDKMSAGTATEDDVKDLENIMSTLQELSVTASEEQIKFNDAVKGFMSVDFEDNVSFTQKAEELRTTYDNLSKNIEDNYTSLKTSLETFKLKVKAMFDNGLIDESKYKENMSLYSNMLKVINSDYDEQKLNLKNTMSGILNGIYNEYENAIALGSSNATVTTKEAWEATLKTGFGGDEKFIKNLDDIINERVRGTYKTIDDELSGMFNDLGIKVDRDYGAEFMYQASKSGEDGMTGFANGIHDNKSKVFNEVSDTFNGVLDRTDEFGTKLADTFNNSIAPLLQSMGNSISNLAGTTSLQINSINYTSSGYRVRGYDGEFADGGFPQTGQLFIARENGIPEMVGSIGGKNAVANNDQIEQAIFKAVYTAMREGNRDNQNSRGTQSNVNLKVSADEHSFVRVAVDGINDITRRTGKSPLKS